ncbi:hypothetical protein [Streptomyces sp. NPDC042319]|uniref:hypothetical protein n=1 Tax=Streptomyces sp. NPDC042319 TaxID=3154332 RepID=UPI0033E80EEC
MVRESNVRMIALASTIALALTLPLAAAIAGPSGPGDPAPAAQPSVSPQLRGDAAERAATTGDGDRPPGTPRGTAQDAPLPGPAQAGAGTGAGSSEVRAGDRPGAPGGDRPGGLLTGLGLDEGHADGRTAVCGPEVGSPHGIKAQTCVLTMRGSAEGSTKDGAGGSTKGGVEGSTEDSVESRTEEGSAGGRTGGSAARRTEGHTKAVLYYRNTSGAPLRAVLTLMRPDGRTVQTHCTLPATGEPGSCGTPSAATVRGGAPYSAVAEIAEVRGDRLLLRAGSNSAPPGAGSAR